MLELPLFAMLILKDKLFKRHSFRAEKIARIRQRAFLAMLKLPPIIAACVPEPVKRVSGHAGTTTDAAAIFFSFSGCNNTHRFYEDRRVIHRECGRYGRRNLRLLQIHNLR